MLKVNACLNVIAHVSCDAEREHCVELVKSAWRGY